MQNTNTGAKTAARVMRTQRAMFTEAASRAPWFVDQYGICGVFGEDGCEALHTLDSLCRKIVRKMRNPEARHKALTLHRTARSFTPILNCCPNES